MENPATWGEVQLTILGAMVEADKAFVAGAIGPSLVTQIYNALKEKGFLKEEY